MLKNINENTIKQFLLEKGYTENAIDSMTDFDYQQLQYDKLIARMITIDEDEFQAWLLEKQEIAKLFGEFMVNHQFLTRRSHITELVTDPSLSSVKDVLLALRRNLVTAPSGVGFKGGHEIPVQNGILIINGAYINQQVLMIKEISRKKPFIAGFIEGSNKKYNEHVLAYYESLRNALKVLQPKTDDLLSPQLKFIEEGKAHVLVRGIDGAQLRALDEKVNQYIYDEYVSPSTR